jgi:hydroxyethylthiazole kinase
MGLISDVAELLKELKKKSPLVHNITNYVTVNDCANILLAIGASPVMADDVEEVEEMVAIAAALVINIGTLNNRTVESMIKAGKRANELGIPVILDPVGVGATTLRTKVTELLLENVKISVIRGNMSEIKIISGINTEIKGVDSIADDNGAEEIARQLSKKIGAVVAITGVRDVIAQMDRVAFIENGHKMLSRVTGTGCMTTALIGAYAGAGKDCFTAAVCGIMTMGLAGEKAYASLNAGEGVGTFRMRLFDSIYNMTPEDLIEGGKLTNE